MITSRRTLNTPQQAFSLHIDGVGALIADHQYGPEGIPESRDRRRRPRTLATPRLPQPGECGLAVYGATDRWVRVRLARLGSLRKTARNRGRSGRRVLRTSLLFGSPIGRQAGTGRPEDPFALPFKWKLRSRAMAGRPAASRQERAQAQELARKIRALREARGWTRERLAKEAGLHTRTLVRLESEGPVQPGFFTVGRLAAALEVSLDDLFHGAGRIREIWSAGYEGRDIDSFVASVQTARIDAVVDVRLTPISRKPGFSKTRLREALHAAGVEYVHLRALGNPKDNRAPFWEGRLEEGRARYRSLLAAEAAGAELTQLAELAGTSRVAVLCFEQDAQRCHRTVVIEEIRQYCDVEVAALA
ncbi:DUF488 family protein [Streptomyces sp. NPDC005968]|uniref:DUF488 family protein, N3 subclade n=1 Tax=Streptomyces sp. NPDC005968 TaxID=3154574 RepID=UPI0033D220C8